MSLSAKAEFLDVIGTKVSRVFLLAVHSLYSQVSLIYIIYSRYSLLCTINASQCRGRILGSNLDKSLKIFPPCCSQSPLLRILLLNSPPPSKSGLKLVCNENNVYRNIKSENSKEGHTNQAYKFSRVHRKSIKKHIFYILDKLEKISYERLWKCTVYTKVSVRCSRQCLPQLRERQCALARQSYP